MSEKQKMCTVMDLPTSTLASLFVALMFTGFHNQFPLLTMLKWGEMIGHHNEKITIYLSGAQRKAAFVLNCALVTREMICGKIQGPRS